MLFAHIYTMFYFDIITFIVLILSNRTNKNKLIFFPLLSSTFTRVHSISMCVYLMLFQFQVIFASYFVSFQSVGFFSLIFLCGSFSILSILFCLG